MKLLLTSGGVTNDSIRETLVDLLGKPIAVVDGTVGVISEGHWHLFRDGVAVEPQIRG